MSRSKLEVQAQDLVRDAVRGVLTSKQAASQVSNLIAVTVAVTMADREDMVEAYDLLRPIANGEIVWCNTCHWTLSEPNPYREGRTRCSNCKEWMPL